MPLQNPQNLNSQMPIDNANLGNVQPNLPIDELKRRFEEIKNQNSALESREISATNQSQDTKLQALKEIFQLMQEMRVDLNNIESINKFIQYLEQQDPDLVILLESAINNLAPQEQQEESSPDLMSRYSNLQQQVMRE